MSLPMFFPSISEDGWVDDPLLAGDYLMSQFFVADYSQTQLYLDQVSSLPYIIQSTQGDTNKLISTIQTTLTKYLGRYFSDVYVESVLVPNPTGSSDIGFTIYVSYVGNDGVTYQLNNIIETLNSKISNVININNTGA